MAQLIDFERVNIGPRTLCATVRIGDDAPLMTSDDIEGTARVYHLMPEIVDHVCIGDAGRTFKQAMGNTEIAHLLEHVTIEILARTNLDSRVSCGRTVATDDERTFDVILDCTDDVLVSGALSSAAWILEWAYNGGKGPEPDVDAIADGLAQLVKGLGDAKPEEPETEPAPETDEPAVEPDVLFDETEAEFDSTPSEDVEEPEAEIVPDADFEVLPEEDELPVEEAADEIADDAAGEAEAAIAIEDVADDVVEADPEQLAADGDAGDPDGPPPMTLGDDIPMPRQIR